MVLAFRCCVTVLQYGCLANGKYFIIHISVIIIKHWAHKCDYRMQARYSVLAGLWHDSDNLHFKIPSKAPCTVYISLYCDKILIMIAAERCFPKANGMQLLHNTFIICIWLSRVRWVWHLWRLALAAINTVCVVNTHRAHIEREIQPSPCVFAWQILLFRVYKFPTHGPNWIRGNFDNGKLKKNQCAQRKIVYMRESPATGTKSL